MPLSKLEKRAQEGDLKALQSLGMMYEVGIGVSKNVEKALFWWGQAAEKGDTVAAYNVAKLYEKTGDQESASLWNRKLRDLNYKSAKEKVQEIIDESKSVKVMRQRPKILVIDDQPTSFENICDFLPSKQFVLEKVETLDDSVPFFKSKEFFQYIFVSLNLESGESLRTLKELNRCFLGNYGTVVALVYRPDEKLIKGAISNGASYVLSVPIDINRFKKITRQAS